jgi:hypothetical protein
MYECENKCIDTMIEKDIFIEKLKKRTKKFAVDIIALCNSLLVGQASSVITYQRIKTNL